MSKEIKRPFRGIPGSLTVRVCVLLVLAALVPLLITVLVSEVLSRPLLISQATTGMQTDAQTHLNQIDEYLGQHIQDLVAVSQFTDVQNYLLGKGVAHGIVRQELANGHRTDPNDDSWSILDANGRVAVSYPQNPQLRAANFQDVLSHLYKANPVLFSDVFYNPVSNKASFDMYAPILAPDSRAVLGYVRVTLNMSYIWNVVNADADANGSGSYAFMLDQHNVFIAYTNKEARRPAALFKTISPLSPQMQQLIKDQDLYGNSNVPVTLLRDDTLAQIQQNPQGQNTFSLTPVTQSQPYQVVRHSSVLFPWTYCVLTPLNLITAVVDQQLLTTVLIASLVLIVMIIAGLGVGLRITHPIMRSVISLDSSSRALKKLAASEQNTVREQQWMIEGSKMGIQSIRYYSNAIDIANNHLQEVTSDLLQRQYHLSHYSEQKLSDIATTTSYIRDAVSRQDSTTKRLETAIRVTTQVTDQLASGATSASEAATQLEEVVRQLRRVVGR